MANYTEYFYEYVENGNQLPSAFDGIPSFNGVSFADMFKKHFNAYEIGLETETLFKERLESKANIVCPFYAAKIAKLNSVSNIFDATREFSLAREDKQASYLNTPSTETIGNDNLAGVLKNNIVENHNEKATPKGTNKIEMMKEYIELENIYQKLLDEFNGLFIFLW